MDITAFVSATVDGFDFSFGGTTEDEADTIEEIVPEDAISNISENLGGELSRSNERR